MRSQLKVRPAVLADATAIARIYGYYVANTAFTFDTDTPTPASMEKRMLECTTVGPWLVAVGRKNPRLCPCEQASLQECL